MTPYRLVIAPNLNVLDAATATRLRNYVNAGGHLVLGPRSGMKDGDDALWSQRQPGALTEILRGRVEYYYPLDQPVAVAGQGLSATAQTWAETLALSGADIVARYGTGSKWLEGQPAIIRSRAGKGSITYVGALLDQDGQNQFTSVLLASVDIATPLSALPASVEVAERVGTSGRFMVLINNGAERPMFATPEYLDQVAGSSLSLSIPAGGIAVLKMRGDEVPTP